MPADIGTKALDPNRFEILRDIMTGYAVLEANERGNWDQFSALLIRMVLKNNSNG
jgi:hypothetical protein